jgi:hypothetical protein
VSVDRKEVVYLPDVMAEKETDRNFSTGGGGVAVCGAPAASIFY